MLFNSLAFFAFIAVFLPLFFLLRNRQRIVLCLVGSYVFYGWWDWRFLSLIAGSTVIDYLIGQRLYNEERSAIRKRWLWTSVAVNLGILAFFKYFNFFIESASSGLNAVGFTTHPSFLEVILPVGISFYTFQTMSYTIDIYRRELTPEHDFLKFATFVSFFPQLVAGPIVRASTFLPQFDHDHNFDRQRVLHGLTQVIVGFFKKLVVADTLAILVDRVYDDPLGYSSLMLIVAGIFYSFQIYCDFSGYSDIAIGLARIMGFNFPENFRRPYFSSGFSEFWQRWHISLSSWLRDYLYISLGGNRRGTIFTYRNLMITMLLGGLWHGANWTFIVWGGLHGLYLILQRLLASSFRVFAQSDYRGLRQSWKALSVLVVFALTTLAWYYFRLPTIEEANATIAKIFAFEGMHWRTLTHLFHLTKGLIVIGLLLLIDILYSRMDLHGAMAQNPVLAASCYAVLLWCIAFFGTFDSNAFIYFQF